MYEKLYTLNYVWKLKDREQIFEWKNITQLFSIDIRSFMVRIN